MQHLTTKDSAELHIQQEAQVTPGCAETDLHLLIELLELSQRTLTLHARCSHLTIYFEHLALRTQALDQRWLQAQARVKACLYDKRVS